MKHFYILFFFLIAVTAKIFAQGNIELNPEERAYLYHIVKKSPILDQNIGRYFEYKGPVIKFLNGEVNFDSVETTIINNPETLFIRTSEIGKSPKGIIAEAANKMALWELNKVLLASRVSDKELDRYRVQYDRFESYLKPKLPSGAFKPGSDEIQKKLLNVLNPSLSFKDKISLLASFNFLSEEIDQLATINAMNAATNEYVQARSFEIFLALGGSADEYKNVLVAAGDGSETSGLLNEREKDENGRWNKGLPKAVGLFPYQVQIAPAEKKKKSELEAQRFAQINFTTVGENKLTQLHFDVWGYNSKKQTTVVIERNGISYHLFGSAETRFLTPDSSFGKGTTFQAVINDLEFNKIGDLKEKIYGKKGFDYLIEQYTKKKKDVEMKIEKNEFKYSSITQQTITTSNKASRKVKKARKKVKKNAGTDRGNYQPTTSSKKKKRGSKQEDIVTLYNQFEGYKKKIAELEKDKESAMELMAQYQQKLDLYKMMMGHSWATFTEKDGLYIFSDSSTFDSYTQEFTFPADNIKTPFVVRLISIPTSTLSNDADEVMLHVNMVDSKPGFDARLQFNLLDAFESNSWQLDRPLFSPADSVAVRQLFEGLLDKKTSFEAIARGQGVGEWNGVQTVRAADRAELDNYEVNRMDTSMVRLRCSQVNVTINRGILMEINTYTDPVQTTLIPVNTDIHASMTRYNLTGNDYLSALRTAQIVRKMKSELNVLAGNYLTREEAKIVIDRLNRELDGMKVSCGPTSWKWQDLIK